MHVSTGIKCPALATPLHATRSGCSEDDVNYGTTCQFNCRDGYKVVNGSLLRTCKADRSWSGAQLVCKGIEIGKKLKYIFS